VKQAVKDTPQNYLQSCEATSAKQADSDAQHNSCGEGHKRKPSDDVRTTSCNEKITVINMLIICGTTLWCPKFKHCCVKLPKYYNHKIEINQYNKIENKWYMSCLCLHFQLNAGVMTLRTQRHYGPKTLWHQCWSVLDISAPVILRTQNCLANNSWACIRSFLLGNRPMCVIYNCCDGIFSFKTYASARFK